MPTASDSSATLAAVAGGCAVLDGGRVSLHRQDGPVREVARGATLVQGGDALVVVGADVRAFDPSSRLLGTFGTGTGITGAAWLDGRVAVGFGDGSVELREAGGAAALDLKDTPASPVTALARGPAGTIAAGFADGTFGVWSLGSGELLRRGAVHGAARHLAVEQDWLMAASEVGSVASLDLSLLSADYCAVLREVWSRVPVSWKDQQAMLVAPSPSHACRTRAGP
ncbi:MAG: hypothetical protein QM765_51465 [Myxococcales bacterium]